MYLIAFLEKMQVKISNEIASQANCDCVEEIMISLR